MLYGYAFLVKFINFIIYRADSTFLSSGTLITVSAEYTTFNKLNLSFFDILENIILM